MRLQGVELRRIRMSLVAPFETSFGVQTERDILLVKVITSDGNRNPANAEGETDGATQRAALIC